MLTIITEVLKRMDDKKKKYYLCHATNKKGYGRNY